MSNPMETYVPSNSQPSGPIVYTRRKWRPKNPTKFLEEYISNEFTDYELAERHDTSLDKARKFIEEMRHTQNLPSRADLKAGVKWEYSDAKEREDFLGFMRKARTLSEIEERFGVEETQVLLSNFYLGYHKFENHNQFGRKIWAFLPDQTDEIVVKPREWQFHRPMSDAGDFYQPYMMAQMPSHIWENPNEELILVPLYDVHYGHHAHKNQKFLQYIDFIKNTPNVYTWGGGDLVENALDDGRGMSYEQEFNPSSQIGTMTRLLAPIAHKMLFMLPGNHEWRTYQKTNIDPTQVMADRLGIPYFDGPAIVDILGVDKRWRIHAQHGNTNSQTKGGKLNSAGRPRKFIQGVHFFVSGHVHDSMANPEVAIDVDPIENRLIYPEQWTIIAPSFLWWEGTYAYRAGYPPPAGGGVSIHLYKDGEYEGKLGSRRDR